MNLFKCQACGQILYFENTICEKCSHRLGYIPEAGTLSALEPHDGTWRALATGDKLYRLCANAEFDVCNWLVAEGDADTFCRACRHNRLIPDIGNQANLRSWRMIERAKHRLLYTLLELGLPLANRKDAPDHGLTFDFPAELPQQNGLVMTGHDNGVITVALAEADEFEREKRRSAMREPYRTLLGHFRHEIGHYYWDRLVRDGGRLETARAFFGDERADYGRALGSYYANGAPGNWQDNFVSAYATAHPWEDFAETWAHYLHIVDTLEMAGAFGMRIHPRLDNARDLSAKVDFDPYLSRDVALLIDVWLPLSTALNCLNRAMGQPDLYPFVLSPPVIEKLGFLHALVHGERDAAFADRELARHGHANCATGFGPLPAGARAERRTVE
jgi:hypothetical protein